jgi:hypothetical protein
VPFIRYTRDKRGYESTYVMHAYRPGQGPQRARVLYLFRTPAHVRIGRQALEPEVKEALEHTHPDLSFDWTNLPSERPAESPDSRERDYRRGRDRDRDRGAPPRQAPRAAPPARPPVLEDESPLGRVVGAERAARLRGRYAELCQRIARRARTPEDRDRLLERLQRLNPEEWGDDAAVRAVVFTVEAAWEAVAAELPSRRRGRRGGRHRRDGGAEQPAGSSGIIEDTGNTGQQDGGHDEEELAMDVDSVLAGGGRGGGVGADLAAAPESRADTDDDGPDVPDPEPGDFQGDR